MAMRIDLVFPTLPPVLDGIGDHTARLAEGLAAGGCDVRVLTAQADADPIPGVAVEQAFSLGKRSGVRTVRAAVEVDPPDWLVLQFNQFSYGRWGLNPHLPFAMREIKQALPQTRIAWMAHEDFVPVTNWKFAIMTLWQRWQFWMLGRTADLIFFSIAPWVQRYQSWFPDTPVRHLPVGSNIPRVDISQGEARRRIGISEETFVVGVFGSAHASRMLTRIQRGVAALKECTPEITVLYVGPHGDVMRESLAGLPLIDAGPLPAHDVSVHLSAMDVHLTPFVDGVSTRRGSFMAGIQHGIPTLSTKGALTDPMLEQADGEAFWLVPVDDPAAFERRAVALLEHPEQRAALSGASRDFYDRQFAWEVLQQRLRAALQECPLRKVLSPT